MSRHSIVFPFFVVPASILGFFYHRAAVGYLNTGRDIRRMESNSRSPIFANFNELLEGIVTVRAFSAEQKFLDDLYKKVDLTTQMWYTFWMTNRWLLLYFDTLGATGVLVTTLFALSGYVKAGTAGVCITSAMAFTTSVYWACRFWTALELDLKYVLHSLLLPCIDVYALQLRRACRRVPGSPTGTCRYYRVEPPPCLLAIVYGPEQGLHGSC